MFYLQQLIFLIILLVSCSNNCKLLLSYKHKKSEGFRNPTYVCVNVAPIKWAQEGSYLTVPSTLKADELSSVRVQSSWTSSSYRNDTLMKHFNISEGNATQADYDNGLAISLSSMGVVSSQRVYRIVQKVLNGTTQVGNVTEDNYAPRSITFPLLMAIINVKGGRVINIQWDSGCLWCEERRCACADYMYDGTVSPACSTGCWVHDSSCAEGVGHNNTSLTNKLCELNVYVSWAGTDVNGMYFKSSASRFTQFRRNQIEHFTSLQSRIIVQQ